jgi:hypothetical protein
MDGKLIIFLSWQYTRHLWNTVVKWMKHENDTINNILCINLFSQVGYLDQTMNSLELACTHVCVCTWAYFQVNFKSSIMNILVTQLTWGTTSISYSSHVYFVRFKCKVTIVGSLHFIKLDRGAMMGQNLFASVFSSKYFLSQLFIFRS